MQNKTLAMTLIVFGAVLIVISASHACMKPAFKEYAVLASYYGDP